MYQPLTIHKLLTPLPRTVIGKSLPDRFSDPFEKTPHPLCIHAAAALQDKLSTYSWSHNFGLDENNHLPVIGKMFGVLIVRTPTNDTGYLSAFSGKIGNETHYDGFVPPVFDTLDQEGFLAGGMRRLEQINQLIDELESTKPNHYLTQVERLKIERKASSIDLSEKLYDQYQLLNQSGEVKSVRELFKGNPPGGAGECAAPKLLQFAFQQQLKPLALGEFYWGKTTKSWKHKGFYPPCEEKCVPLLQHMLKGL